MALFLALLSEYAVSVARVGHPIALLREVWQEVGNVFGFVQELWTERYKGLFATTRDSL